MHYTLLQQPNNISITVLPMMSLVIKEATLASHVLDHILRRRYLYEYHLWVHRNYFSYLPLDAESSSVIYNAFADPGNGLGGTFWGMTQYDQSRSVFSGFTNSIYSCKTKKIRSYRLINVEKTARNGLCTTQECEDVSVGTAHSCKIFVCLIKVNKMFRIKKNVEKTAKWTSCTFYFYINLNTETLRAVCSHPCPGVILQC